MSFRQNLSTTGPGHHRPDGSGGSGSGAEGGEEHGAPRKYGGGRHGQSPGRRTGNLYARPTEEQSQEASEHGRMAGGYDTFAVGHKAGRPGADAQDVKDDGQSGAGLPGKQPIDGFFLLNGLGTDGRRCMFGEVWGKAEAFGCRWCR